MKSADEDPWWPTAKPVDADGRPHSAHPREINGIILAPGDDVAARIIHEAHAQGLRIIAYYWDSSEETLAARNDGSVCRKPDGRPFNAKRGTPLDLTGPYREVVLTRLIELVERGVDGFFFDHLHLPLEGCWGTALEEAWKAETGDAAAPPLDHSDPRYLRFLDFKAEKIEETFAYWRDAVKARHPEVVFVVSTDMFASLMNREVTTRLAAIADSAKNEYCQALRRKVDKAVFKTYSTVLAKPLPHVRQSLCWTVLRDSSDGRPPHIWHPGVPSTEQAEAYAASLMTFGAVANMVTYEHNLVSPLPQPGKHLSRA